MKYITTKDLGVKKKEMFSMSAISALHQRLGVTRDPFINSLDFSVGLREESRGRGRKHDHQMDTVRYTSVLMDDMESNLVEGQGG